MKTLKEMLAEARQIVPAEVALQAAQRFPHVLRKVNRHEQAQAFVLALQMMPHRRLYRDAGPKKTSQERRHPTFL